MYFSDVLMSPNIEQGILLSLVYQVRQPHNQSKTGCRCLPAAQRTFLNKATALALETMIHRLAFVVFDFDEIV